MLIDVSEATGEILDWMVAKIESRGKSYVKTPKGKLFLNSPKNPDRMGYYTPSSDWSQGGPIVDMLIDRKYIMQKGEFDTGVKVMHFNNGNVECAFGPTLLIAAMRCYIMNELGDKVDVPDMILIH